MYIDSAETRYLVTDQGYPELTNVADGFEIVSGSLVAGDEVDFSTVIYDKTYATAYSDGTTSNNTIDMNAFTIVNRSRGVNVTSNYKIIEKRWGTLTKL